MAHALQPLLLNVVRQSLCCDYTTKVSYFAHLGRNLGWILAVQAIEQKLELKRPNVAYRQQTRALLLLPPN